MNRLFLLLSALLLIGLIWWAAARNGAYPEVHFTAARKATIESVVSTNGKVEPAEWAAARAEAGGTVASLAVDRGDDVRVGQLLVALDQTAAQSDLAAAQARRQEAQAEQADIGSGGKPGTVASLDSSVKTAAAALEIAQRNYDSQQRLQAQGAATKLQVNEAHDALERSRLQLIAAQAQRKALVTPNDRAIAKAKLNDADAAVLLAQRSLALRRVLAPIDGTVYQFNLKIGSYLHPGDEVALIGNLDQMKVTMYVDEPDLGRVAVGMPVQITWDARPGEVWPGQVQRLPTEVTALGTRTVGEVTTLVQNLNHSLLPGVSVNATVVSHVAKDALAIPKSALRTIDGKSGVFLLRGKSLHWTIVSAGGSDLNNVQIKEGLQTGDLVADRIMSPADAELTDGLRVKPSEAH